jgi:3-hydroxyacyl-[acyl-carrier-protein] dehydratase
MKAAREANKPPPPLMDVRAICELLPHRYPFLLVDRVLEIEPLKRIRAMKSVSVNEPFFQGHFPGLPVMPGVLIVEALAQAAALLAFRSGVDATGKVIYLLGLDGVRFRRPVVPGDQLELVAEALKHKESVWKYKAVAYVEGQVAAEAELLAMLADRES